MKKGLAKVKETSNLSNCFKSVTLIFLILSMFIVCGRNEVEDKRFKPVAPNKTPTTQVKTKDNDLLPPLYLFNLPLPKHFDYQSAYLNLIESATSPAVVLKDIKTLKAQLDRINEIFEETRLELSKIRHEVKTGNLTPLAVKPLTVYLTEYDPVTRIQSRLTIEGTPGSSLSWKLETKRRVEEYFVPIFAGRLDVLSPTQMSGNFTFKHRHSDAPNTQPLDLFYTFTIADFVPSAPANQREIQQFPPTQNTNNNTAKLTPGLYKYKYPNGINDPSFNLVDAQSDDIEGLDNNFQPEFVHTEMTSSLWGQLYKQVKKAGKATTYTPVNVKWNIRQNLTMTSGFIMLNKATLEMGDATNTFKTKLLDKSFRFTWGADGSGKTERFNSDITATNGPIQPKASSTVCWSSALKLESCSSNTQLEDNPTTIVNNSNDNNQPKLQSID